MPTPTITPEVIYAQHPDDLIQTVDRNKPTAPPPEPTKEEVEVQEKAWQELKKDVPSLLFGAKKKEPTEEEKKAAADAEAKKVEEAKKAAEGNPPQNEPPKKKVRKAPDALEIARETGKAIADSLKPVVAPQPPVEPKETVDPSVGLSAEDKDTYELFKVLAESDPDRYKDAPTQFTSFVKKLASYQKRWTKENPDKSFDPNDSEHEDFYSANQPSFSEADLDKARVRLETRKEVERTTAELKKQYESRIAEVENKAVVPEIARQAEAHSNEAVNQFVAAIPDETLRKVVSESPDKLREADPLAFDVLDNEAANLRQQVSELHNIIHRKNYYNPDNPLHQALTHAVVQQESAIKQLPLNQQKYDGKMFATRGEWDVMTPAQRSQHWILAEADVINMLSHRSSHNAVKIIEAERKRIESLAQKYGYIKGAASATPPTGTPAAAVTPPASGNKPVSPASPSGGALPPTNTPSNKAEESEAKRLVKALF